MKTVGLLDLSIVTDQLLDHLRKAKDDSALWEEEPTAATGASPSDDEVPAGDQTPQTEFNIVFTGQPPDAARELAGTCKVSLYLFHVAADKFYRNTFPADWRAMEPEALEDSKNLVKKGETRARQGAQQPLALTLYYLLSAHSDSYIQEQQAMSIALKCFHDRSVVTAFVPMTAPTPKRPNEFTITLEAQSIDEIGRLWQSMASALRLSAVYRASVIFLEPKAPTKSVEPVKKWTQAAYPQFVVTSANITASGLVTVRGNRFKDPSLKVSLAGREIAATDPETFGTYHVVDENQLLLQLPHGTAKGLVRLGITLVSEELESIFTLRVETDVP
jgi:Pvc16 N-terminal domain